MMDGLGNLPPFDEEHYHLAIVEKKGRFSIYADLDGLRQIQAELNEAAESIDHGLVFKRGDRQFMVGSHKLDIVILWAYSHDESTVASLKPGKKLEVTLTSSAAEHLFKELGRMASQVEKGKEPARLELPYGVTIEYLKDW